MSHLVSPAAPAKKATGANLRRYMRELGDYMDLAATGTLAAAEAGTDVILANAVAPPMPTMLLRPSVSPPSVPGKAPYDAPSARLRQMLGLPKKARAASDRTRRKTNSPVLHGISPTVFPRPAD